MKLVFIENNRPVTDSLVVAETFGKRHDNVLRDIKELECSPEFSLLNFEESSYTAGNGQQYMKYLITQDGFAFLVMGYTGREAARFKEMYIGEFNRMRDELTKPQFTLPQTMPEALRLLASEMEQRALAEAEKERIAAEKLEAEKKLTLQAPQVAMYQLTMAADNTQPVGTVARVVGMGRNNLFKFLREQKIMMPNTTIPYQRFIDAGYFVVKEVPTPRGDRVENVAMTRVTAKGLDYIAKLVKQA